jgi:hypothetical protein
MHSQDLENDCKKYESELVNINKQLADMDQRKQELIRIGNRVEGAIAYIKLKITQGHEAKKEMA